MKTCNYWIIGGIIAMAVILILAIKRNEGFRPTSTIARAGSCCGGRYLTPTYRQMAMLPGSFNSNYEGAGCCGIFDGCFCTKGKNSREISLQARSTPFTSEGKLVDARSYSISEERWNNSPSAGGITGLLTDDGTVYILIANMNILNTVIAKRARVCGYLMSDSGAVYVTKLEVFTPANGSKKGGWSIVKLD